MEQINKEILSVLQQHKEFSIPDLQSSSGFSYKELRSTVKQLEREAKIILEEGITFKWLIDPETYELPSEKKPENTGFSFSKYRHRFSNLFNSSDDDDDDDDDDDSKENDEDEKEDGEEKREEENEDDDDDEEFDFDETFHRMVWQGKDSATEEDYKNVQIVRPSIGVSYPDGTPFEMEVFYELPGWRITDNGGMKNYLLSITEGVTPSLRNGWIDEMMNDLGDFPLLEYSGDKIERKIICSDVYADLDRNMFCFIRHYNSFLEKINRLYGEKTLDDDQEAEISMAIAGFISDMKDFTPNFDDGFDGAVASVIAKIIMLHHKIYRTRAISVAEQLLSLAKATESEYIDVYENVVTELSEMVDIEFMILKNRRNGDQYL